MRKFLFFIPLFLWTCGGGGGGSSPTEPVDPNPSPPTQLEIVSVEYNLSEMIISWSGSIGENFLRYNLFHSLTQDGEKELIYSTSDKTVTSYTTSDFNPALYNWFFIEVVSTDGLKTMSIGKSNTKDSHPLQINFNNISWDGSQVIFSWNKSSDTDFKSYTIYSAGNETMYNKSVIWTSTNIDELIYYFSSDCGSSNYYTIEVEDIWGLKTEGDILRSNSYYEMEHTFNLGTSSTSRNVPQAIFETSDGGVLIGGVVGGSVGIFTLKLNDKGQKESYQTYGGNYFGSMDPTDDGGYLISASKSNDIFLIRTDANGNELWSSTYDLNGGTDGQDGGTIGGVGLGGSKTVQLDDGSFIISVYGDVSNTDSGNQSYLLKIDGSGQLIWVQTTEENFGSSRTHIFYKHSNNSFEAVNSSLTGGGRRIRIDSDGNQIYNEALPVVCSGCYKQDIILNNNQEYAMALWYPKIWSLKLDQNLNLIWKIEYIVGDNSDGYKAMGITQTSDDGYLIIGRQRNESDSSNTDIVLIKTDLAGNKEWIKSYDNSNNDIGYEVKETTNGDYIIAGASSSDIYFLRLDSNGSVKAYCN
jgi:hypothetical protein